MAPNRSIGKSGQLLHMVPPLTVKSTISDAVCGPSELTPVVTRILETVSQKRQNCQILDLRSHLKFCTTLENKVFLNLKLAKDGTIESCSYVLLFCISFLLLIRRKEQMGQKKVPLAAKKMSKRNWRIWHIFFLS